MPIALPVHFSQNETSSNQEFKMTRAGFEVLKAQVEKLGQEGHLRSKDWAALDQWLQFVGANSRLEKVTEEPEQEENGEPEQDEQVEPLCDPKIHHRLCLRPYKEPVYVKFRKEEIQKFWHEDEIKYGEDRADFLALHEYEQSYFAQILGFFANSDNAVIEQINRQLMERIECPELLAALTVQNFFEGIHAETYLDQIEACIPDAIEREKLFRQIEHDPYTQKKVELMVRYGSFKPGVLFHQQLLAQLFFEGILFQQGFAVIFWMREQGKFPGITLGNSKIVEDEAMHVRRIAYAAKTCKYKLPDEKVYSIMEEYVNAAIDFVNAKCPFDLESMNKHKMANFIKNTADSVLWLMDMPAYYHAPQPFDFMEGFTLFGKTNFFERSVSEYASTTSHLAILDICLPNFGDDI